MHILKECPFVGNLLLGHVTMEITIAGSVKVKSHFKSANFKCRSCEKVFKAQSECLKHRKQEHSNLVPLRKNETNGTCTFGNINCWVIHENTNKPNNNENLEKLILNNLIHQHRAWDVVRSAVSALLIFRLVGYVFDVFNIRLTQLKMPWQFPLIQSLLTV